MPLNVDDLPNVYRREKIHFRLAQDEDGYPPVTVESLWGIERAADLYVIDNIPFYIGSLGVGDVVRVGALQDGSLWFLGIVEESGHGTIRVYVTGKAVSGEVQEGIRQLGFKFEMDDSCCQLAVDIPPRSDVQSLLAYLQEMKARGIAGYSEPCKTW